MDDKFTFEVLSTPIKSESDRREYKVIKLKNGLVACMISDSSQLHQDDGVRHEINNGTNEKKLLINEKKAAVMLSIGVGSFSNPKEIQGMAHFLEHMVFMGSEKFPTENDFSSFISKRGGVYNAFTSDESTCFFFDCLETHLKEAVDKMAQFFIAPLLKKEAMTREREAVDSEFQMILVSDYARQQQLIASLAKNDSPVNSFSCGNLKTLKDNIDDDELHEAVHEFRKKHYSAHRISLATQSRLPMDQLQDLVVEYFSGIPSNRLPKDDFSAFEGTVYKTEKFNRIYYIKPIDECVDININWPLPPLFKKYKSKSIKYLSYILSYEGKGSLLSYLKKHMWAVNAYPLTDQNSMCSFFTYYIQLTEEGFSHIFEIIRAVFSYINLIKQVGPLERIYNDIKLISDTAFKFETEELAVNTVLNLAESMDNYAPEHFLTGSKIHYEFDPVEIAMIIDHLNPNNVNILVSNKKLPNELTFNQSEKWFGTEYIDAPISENLKTEWENVKPFTEFEIPAPNPYLSKIFEILPDLPNHPDYPQKIINTDKCELWYRQDQKFELPLGYYYFGLISPTFLECPKNSVLTDLFTELLRFCLDEVISLAILANYNYSIWFCEKCVNITVYGYNEKISPLIDVIVKHMINLEDYITEQMFLGLKETILRSEYNNIRTPANLLHDAHLKLLISNKWAPIEKYNALLTLTYTDMKEFIKEYRKEMYVKALVQGNIDIEDATSTVNNFLEVLTFDPLPELKYPTFTVAEVPIGEHCLFIESFNKDDSNSVTENYYQVGPFTMRNSVIIDLIMLIMEDPVFDILRTKEQLGYSVYCCVCETEGTLGYSVGIATQAHKYTTEYLDERIEAFIKHSQKILEDTTVDDLEQIKQDYIKTKKCIDVQLAQEVSRNWSEIVKDEYIFDRSVQEVKVAEDITLDEVKIWWCKHNHFGERDNYRKISLQVAGHVQDDANISKEKTDKKETVDELYGKPMSIIYLGNNKENKKDNLEYFIENIDNFRNEMGKYPPKQIKKGA